MSQPFSNWRRRNIITVSKIIYRNSEIQLNSVKFIKQFKNVKLICLFLLQIVLIFRFIEIDFSITFIEILISNLHIK